MKVAELSTNNAEQLREVMELMEETVLVRKEYLKAITILFEMKDEFKEDEEFCVLLWEQIISTTNLWKEDLERKKREGKRCECDCHLDK